MKRPVEPISDRNPRVVSAVKLSDAAHRRRTGLFVAEGPNAVSGALDAGLVEEIFIAESAEPRFARLLADADVPAHRISERAARQLSDTVTSPGLFAVCRHFTVRLDDVLAETSPRLVAVLVEASDPGNAGTVIRVADAAGADAVVLAGDSVDPHNSKCVRASAGSVFHLPVARERDAVAAVGALRGSGLQLLATAAAGDAELSDPAFAQDALAQPTAWLLGNEAHGLPAALHEQADRSVRIPIYGRAESLNLATAAALCLYESAKCQRLRIRSSE
jgi:TrmH family RNA methyltransferase